MSELKFRPRPKDYPAVIAELKKHIEWTQKDIADFERRHFNGAREEAVIYCLRRAVDLAQGSLAVALEELPDSIATLSRAALETLFWARYITMSEENAQEFVDSTINEMKRISRKNLNAGYASVYEISTNADKTADFLTSPEMQNIPQRVSIESAAQEGGLERVYTNVYGFMSMIAHGRAFDLWTPREDKEDLYSSLCITLGALECTEVIATDWITHRKQTPQETLVRMLGA